LSVEDPDNLFANEAISPDGARFAGGGIPSGFCEGGGEDFRTEFNGCGDFFIDLVGFPRGTDITMTASTVPEPGALLLLGTGVALAFVSVRRRVR
jgi:hypothetical protein